MTATETTAPAAAAQAATNEPPVAGAPCVVRHFAVDGSVFLDGDYLIKGVSGEFGRSRFTREFSTKAGGNTPISQ